MNQISPYNQKQRRLGFFAALGAHLCWGIVTVIYINRLASVNPVEVIGHRIVWSLFVLLILLGLSGKFGEFLSTLRSRRQSSILGVTAMLISANWFIFTVALQRHQGVEASLGYFITPLFNVALGMMFLRERLRPMQWIAIALGVSSVVVLAVAGETFPWIALALAITFGLYGLLRKMVDVDSAIGLTVECLVIVPIGFVVIGLSAFDPTSTFSNVLARRDVTMFVLLACAGLVTAIPLLLFGFAALRLSLTSLGFIQYIGPTFQWLMAVLIYHEPLEPVRLLACVLIWIGLLIYSLDMLYHTRRAWHSRATDLKPT